MIACGSIMNRAIVLSPGGCPGQDEAPALLVQPGA